ncbi:ROK family protein [Microbacterium sp. zg.B48]|uniref:ROK family protein n=1 Tax=unclassified Microbacterium TaxID=2609290 RepID=UPI00214AC471|nr:MULTISPECIES: ROK family protein [unclassified Microbacterium]MCR2762645.1 ROK family protein [Microbacterium sp. zg.B48]MCR2808203.1 ROK family protein [Microbacterium sp. zg.B185]WIM19337.1 ROK family protein [Microbacterium sp. zg-B185]
MSNPLSPTASLRRANLGAMLSHAWDTDVFTASDAMATVGLTRSTTIDVIEELVGIGLLRELPNARAGGDYQKGRPARRFELRHDVASVVGVDVGPDHILTAVADLRGRLLAKDQYETDLEHDSPAERRAAATAAVDAALRASGRARADVLAVCAGVPAPVNARGESPPHRTGFWQRMNPDLMELFGRWAPLVRVENDASLAAIAEGSIGAAVGESDYVTLLTGEFLGAGAVVDGRLLRGAHGGIAEMMAFDHVVGVGGAWGLDPRLVRSARESLAAGEFPAAGAIAQIPAVDLRGERILELARAGDADAEVTVARIGQMVSIIAGVFGSLFDPRRVILSGLPADSAAQVVAAARASLNLELDLPAPELSASRLGADVVCIGAVSAALEAAREGVLDLGGDWTAGGLRRTG